MNRFLEVDLHFREVEKELAKYPSERRIQLEKIMIQDLAEDPEFGPRQRVDLPRD